MSNVSGMSIEEEHNRAVILNCATEILIPCDEDLGHDSIWGSSDHIIVALTWLILCQEILFECIVLGE
jgi:hypothetical protein